MLRRTVAAVVLALPLVLPVPMQAGNAGALIVVTTFDDELVIDGDCSLREAVAAANSDLPVDGCAGGGYHDNIVLPEGTYHLGVEGAEEDLGVTGDLDLTGGRTSVSVDGRGLHARATIDGGGLDRIFDVRPAATFAAFHRLVLRGGDAGTGEGGAIRFDSGVCDEFGAMPSGSVTGSLIEDSRGGRGGGVHIGDCRSIEVRWASIVNNVATEVGGALSVEGRAAVYVDTSTISGNSAGVAGGGMWGAVTEEGNVFAEYSTLANNSAPDGAAIWSARNDAFEAVIVADHSGPACGGGAIIGSQGVSDDATCAGNSVEDVGLLPLERVGGVAVHRLAAGSAAIDHAGPPRPNGWCASQTIDDQLGAERPVDGDGDGEAWCDAGAIEAPAASSEPEPTSGPSPVSGGGSSPLVPDTAASTTRLSNGEAKNSGVLTLSRPGRLIPIGPEEAD
jgi:CSLREA domain-containing protein